MRYSKTSLFLRICPTKMGKSRAVYKNRELSRRRLSYRRRAKRAAEHRWQCSSGASETLPKESTIPDVDIKSGTPFEEGSLEKPASDSQQEEPIFCNVKVESDPFSEEEYQELSDSAQSENSEALRLALVQLAVGENKTVNISRAVSFIEQAKQRGADIVALPECFNSPYGTAHFPNYAEDIPTGETSLALSAAAKSNEICVVGGSIPERDGDKFFNTCTVWSPEGKLIGKYRKMHLFDIDVKGKITFKESDTLTPGNDLTTFQVKQWKVGLGICYDIRFEELARLYRNSGCQLLLYPGAFNMTTGPLHWSLLQRARATDNQLYVAAVSPARGTGAGYIAYGHTQLTDPWGKVLNELEFAEDIIVADIDMAVVDEVRAQIPVFSQRRTDLYDTAWKRN